MLSVVNLMTPARFSMMKTPDGCQENFKENRCRKKQRLLKSGVTRRTPLNHWQPTFFQKNQMQMRKKLFRNETRRMICESQKSGGGGIFPSVYRWRCRRISVECRVWPKVNTNSQVLVLVLNTRQWIPLIDWFLKTAFRSCQLCLDSATRLPCIQ